MPYAPTRAALLALVLYAAVVRAQTVPFQLQSLADSPVALLSYTPGSFRDGQDRRQFITIQNRSAKAASAVTFEQSVANDGKTEMIALERVSILIAPRDKKRVSVSVGDILKKTGTPLLSVVAVEFADGTLWNAP